MQGFCGNRCNPGCRTSVLSDPKPSLCEPMFLRRRNEDRTALSLDEIRDSLSDRLRLVFDFATLGAYDEYAERDDRFSEIAHSSTDGPGATTQVAARTCCTGAEAKRRPAQAHAQAAAVPCEEGTARGNRCRHAAGRGTATRSRFAASGGAARRERAGRVPVPQQPCVWPDA